MFIPLMFSGNLIEGTEVLHVQKIYVLFIDTAQ
jgi:hypothetical protein